MLTGVDVRLCGTCGGRGVDVSICLRHTVQIHRICVCSVSIRQLGMGDRAQRRLSSIKDKLIKAPPGDTDTKIQKAQLQKLDVVAGITQSSSHSSRQRLLSQCISAYVSIRQRILAGITHDSSHSSSQRLLSQRMPACVSIRQRMRGEASGGLRCSRSVCQHTSAYVSV